MPDPDLEIRGGWSSRPLDKGGAQSPKKIILFHPFGPQFGLKIGREGGGGVLGPSPGAVTGSYSTHQITSDTQNFQFPSITFLPRTYYFVQISQPTNICLKNRYFEEQFNWVPLYILAMSTLHQTNFHCLGVPFTPNHPKSLSVQKFRNLHVARSENIEQSTPSERCAW